MAYSSGMNSSVRTEARREHISSLTKARKGDKAWLWFTEEQDTTITDYPCRGLDRLIIPLITATVVFETDQEGFSDTYQLRTGQCLFIPASLATRRSDCEIDGHCLVVDIDPYIRAVLENEYSKGHGFGDTLTICRRSTELLELVRSGRRYLNIGIDQFSAFVDSLAIMMLTELILNHKHSEAIAANSLTDEALEDIQAFIDKNLEQSIALEQLANLCGLSVYNFSKAFKAKTGSSPYKFVTNRRIAKSCELLCTTGNSIADIAYKVGFSSQSHMTELFRKTLGTTPARYRKQFSKMMVSA